MLYNQLLFLCLSRKKLTSYRYVWFQDNWGLNSTTDLVINVLDVPDTAPFFSNLPYVEEVDEGITNGTFIVMVTAQDGDRGINNPVNYSFYDDGSDNYE